jgi:hypothetical protein
VKVGRVDRSPTPGVHPTFWRQLARSVEQQRGGSRRAARPCVASGIVEHTRNLLVRLVRGRGELPRTRFGVVEQLREPFVDLVTAEGRGGLVCAGREQRVREPDARPIQLHEAGV